MNTKNVFFHKIVNNTIICKSIPLSVNKTEINGVSVFTREQGQVTYGLMYWVESN